MLKETVDSDTLNGH